MFYKASPSVTDLLDTQTGLEMLPGTFECRVVLPPTPMLPGCLFRLYAEGKDVVSFFKDGSVAYGPDVTPSEAAREFWAQVNTLATDGNGTTQSASLGGDAGHGQGSDQRGILWRDSGG